MLRSIYTYIKIALFAIYIEPRYWKIKRLDKANRIDKKDAILLKTAKQLAKVVLNPLKIKVKFEGKEHLPKDGTPYILTPNHSSLLDIPILFEVLDGLIGFVSKEENKKIPFFGRWISLIYSVYIDRSSARNAIKSLNKGAEIIKAGHPQVIFPEGTRTRDGKVLEFKAGSYKLAKKADALVIPVAITGAYDILKKGSYFVRPGTVKVKFFEPINSELDTFEMAEFTQNLIAREIEKEAKGV